MTTNGPNQVCGMQGNGLHIYSLSNEIKAFGKCMLEAIDYSYGKLLYYSILC